MTQNSHDDLVTTVDAARAVGVKPYLIVRWIHRGVLSGVMATKGRVQHTYRVRLSDVQRVAASRRTKSEAAKLGWVRRQGQPSEPINRPVPVAPTPAEPLQSRLICIGGADRDAPLPDEVKIEIATRNRLFARAKAGDHEAKQTLTSAPYYLTRWERPGDAGRIV